MVAGKAPSPAKELGEHGSIAANCPFRAVVRKYYVHAVKM